jgi:hypothetical protein
MIQRFYKSFALYFFCKFCYFIALRHKSGSCPGRATDFDHIKQCKPLPNVNSGTVSETSGVMISGNQNKKGKQIYF